MNQNIREFIKPFPCTEKQMLTLTCGVFSTEDDNSVADQLYSSNRDEEGDSFFDILWFPVLSQVLANPALLGSFSFNGSFIVVILWCFYDVLMLNVNQLTVICIFFFFHLFIDPFNSFCCFTSTVVTCYLFFIENCYLSNKNKEEF